MGGGLAQAGYRVVPPRYHRYHQARAKTRKSVESKSRNSKRGIKSMRGNLELYLYNLLSLVIELAIGLESTERKALHHFLEPIEIWAGGSPGGGGGVGGGRLVGGWSGGWWVGGGGW